MTRTEPLGRRMAIVMFQKESYTWAIFWKHAGGLLTDLQSYDFILSHNGNTVDEELNPGLEKIAPVEDGFILHNVTGIRAHIVSRLDGKGYAITRRK